MARGRAARKKTSWFLTVPVFGLSVVSLVWLSFLFVCMPSVHANMIEDRPEPPPQQYVLCHLLIIFPSSLYNYLFWSPVVGSWIREIGCGKLVDGIA